VDSQQWRYLLLMESLFPHLASLHTVRVSLRHRRFGAIAKNQLLTRTFKAQLSIFKMFRSS